MLDKMKIVEKIPCPSLNYYCCRVGYAIFALCCGYFENNVGISLKISVFDRFLSKIFY